MLLHPAALSEGRRVPVRPSHILRGPPVHAPQAPRGGLLVRGIGRCHLLRRQCAAAPSRHFALVPPAAADPPPRVLPDGEALRRAAYAGPREGAEPTLHSPAHGDLRLGCGVCRSDGLQGSVLVVVAPLEGPQEAASRRACYCSASRLGPSQAVPVLVVRA